MARFEIAYDITAVNEGGYSNNPSDKGNFYKGFLIGTNKGISAPVLASFLGRTPTVQEMKTLPTDVAKLIYKRNYWDVMRGDNWNNQDMANHVYDMCVNAGCGAAIKLWQMAMGIPVTGKMDNLTLLKTNLL